MDIETDGSDTPHIQKRGGQISLFGQGSDSNDDQAERDVVQNLEMTGQRGGSEKFYQHYRHWRNAVDHHLMEGGGITAAVLPRLNWKAAHRADVCPEVAAKRALSFLRSNESKEVRERRRILRSLVSRVHPHALAEAVKAADEPILRSALRVSTSSQQQRIEQILEQELLGDL